jgi:hypothetical protein
MIPSKTYSARLKKQQCTFHDTQGTFVSQIHKSAHFTSRSSKKKRKNRSKNDKKRKKENPHQTSYFADHTSLATKKVFLLSRVECVNANWEVSWTFSTGATGPASQKKTKKPLFTVGIRGQTRSPHDGTDGDADARGDDDVGGCDALAGAADEVGDEWRGCGCAVAENAARTDSSSSFVADDGSRRNESRGTIQSRLPSGNCAMSQDRAHGAAAADDAAEEMEAELVLDQAQEISSTAYCGCACRKELSEARECEDEFDHTRPRTF